MNKQKRTLLISFFSILILSLSLGIVQARGEGDGDGRGGNPPPRQRPAAPPAPPNTDDANARRANPPADGVTAPDANAATVSNTNEEAAINMQAPNVVIQWNEAMLAAIRHGPPRPTVISRALFMVHTAMYDAWSMYDPIAMPTTLDTRWSQPESEQTLANKESAVSQAAYQMLMALFPEYEANTQTFSQLLAQLGYQPIGSTDNPSTAESIGHSAAIAVLQARSQDGSNAANNFADMPTALYGDYYHAINSANPADANTPGNEAFNMSRWQPLRIPTGSIVDEFGQPVILNEDANSYIDQTFLTPHWGSVRPFALSSGDQFRPAQPPQAGSDAMYVDGLGNVMTHNEAYWQQMNEVITISANLTDAQKVMAEYWADGPRSETPPGHWNALAHGISWRDEHTLDDDVKLFFALNGALFDAGIAAWDSKRAYDYIRPASAIRHAYANELITAWGGPNLGTQTIQGINWQPYQASTFVTPAFAEYVSGHSTFSMAAAEILTQFTGSNQFYDGVTVVNEDFNRDGIYDMLGQYVAPANSNHFEAGPAEVVVLQWATFQDAAVEAGLSRLYGGIHFQDGDLNGRTLGLQVGTMAFNQASAYWLGLTNAPTT